MIINLKTPTELSSFSVVYMGSTFLETPGKNRGISHLMEHLLCKNLEFKQNDYDTDGITFNAYTDSDRIVFYLSGLNSKLVNYRDEFIKLIGKFNDITEEDFSKERNIVSFPYTNIL